MENQVKIFKSEQFGEIRTAGTAENPMFCLADICRVLELDQPSRVKSRLKQDGVTLIKVIDKIGREQQATFINEQNLYKVIMRSDKPQAEPFQDWVCGEVLPTIRKTGTYTMANQLPDFTNPAEAARAWAHEYEQKLIEARRADEAEQENKRLESENLQLAIENQELRNDKSYLDLIMRSKALLTISQIAQDYGMSGKAMNKILADLKIQYSMNGQWILYAAYKDKGYVSSQSIAFTRCDGRKDFRLHTYWTQEGRKFLYQLLKDDGIIPMLERN